MGAIANARLPGRIGSVLLLFTLVPGIGWVVALAGLVLVLLAIKQIGDALGDRRIFENTLIAMALAIIGTVVGTIVIVDGVYHFLGLNGLLLWRFGGDFTPPAVSAGNWPGLIVSILEGLVAVWVALTVSAVYIRRSLDELARRLKVPEFRAAGLVYLVGAATTIVFAGFALLFVGVILLAIGFFSIPGDIDVPDDSARDVPVDGLQDQA